MATPPFDFAKKLIAISTVNVHEFQHTLRNASFEDWAMRQADFRRKRKRPASAAVRVKPLAAGS
jgi:hypothetical protein